MNAIFKPPRRDEGDVREPAPAAEERRQAPRTAVFRDSQVEFENGRQSHCLIRDISETGLRIDCEAANLMTANLWIRVFGERWLCRVVWQRALTMGLEYIRQEPLNP